MGEICVLHRTTEDEERRIGPYADHTVAPEDLAVCLQSRQSWRYRWPEEEVNSQWFLLTFDDGYRNNLTEAIPILEHFDAKAIIFVTTGFIDGNVYPYELELASVIEKENQICIEKRNSEVNISSFDEKNKIYSSLRKPLKNSSHRERESALEEMANYNEYDRGYFQNERFLSWEEVVELDRHPLIRIGAHTHTHPVLTRRLPWVAYREMKRSKRKIERATGHEVRYLSYPYGRNNAIVRTLARLAGFQWGFTTESRRVTNPESNPLALPRIGIQNFI